MVRYVFNHVPRTCFPRPGAFSSWPTWRCPPDVDTSGEKAGESSFIEQILDIASHVVRMICRATHLPCGERQFYTRRENSTIGFFKEANPASLQTRMIYVVAYKVVKTSRMDLVAGHLEPTKGKSTRQLPQKHSSNRCTSSSCPTCK